MTVSTLDVHQAAGGFHIDLDWDPEMAEATRLRTAAGTDRTLFARYYRGEELHFGGVLLARPAVNEEGIALEGRSYRVLLGNDRDGSPIADRTYWSGRQKLSNGSFEDGWDAWSTREDTAWGLALIGPAAHEGGIAAGVTLNPSADDVIQSTESWDVRAGEQYWLNAFALRAAVEGVYTRGRLRLRIVLTGRFDRPNLLDGTWGPFVDNWPANAVSGPAAGSAISVFDPAHSISGGPVMRFAPLGRPQLVKNHSFETWSTLIGPQYGNFWLAGAGEWYSEPVAIVDGLLAVSITGAGAGGSGLRWLQSIANTPGTDVEFHRVVEGETYRVEGLIRHWPGTDGKAEITTLVHRTDHNPATPEKHEWVETRDVDSGDNKVTVGAWLRTSVDIEIRPPEEGQAPIDGLVPTAEVRDCTTGTWSFDRVTLTRIGGNRQSITSGPITLVPEMDYVVEAPALFEKPKGGGSVAISVALTSEGRVGPVIFTGAAEEGESGSSTEPHVLHLEFTPPSGYDSCTVTITATDLAGHVWVDQDKITLRQRDDKVRVYESRSAIWWANWLPWAVLCTVPLGAERMHVEVAAEEGAAAWALDDLLLYRYGVVGSTVAQVARDLLNDPATGWPVLAPGNIVGTDVIRYDWRVAWLTQAEALHHLATSGLASPQREDRVHPDGTYDFGLPEQIYEDRTDVVLREGDYKLLATISVGESIEDAVNAVAVIGADRLAPDGTHQPVLGGAAVSTGRTNLFGQPLNRTRMVQDSSVEVTSHARDFADYELARSAPVPALSRIALSDPVADFDRIAAGQWIYIEAPSAGVEDEGNAELVGGEMIAPERKRVLSVSTNYGSGGNRVAIYDPVTGVETTLRGVRWSDADTVELEVGERLPEFTTDADAGTVAAQFRRFRAIPA